MRSMIRNLAKRATRMMMALCMLAVGCGPAPASETRSATSSSGGESDERPPVSPFEAALDAAVVASREGPELRSTSLTVSGGCTIPCGESGVGGHGPIMVLTPSDDPTYGITQANPIRVGGVSGYHEARYLRALWGPEGQPIRFERIGSCCPMPEGGLLDAILVEYEGLDEAIVLYLDAYHAGPLQIPVGFTGTPRGADR